MKVYSINSFGNLSTGTIATDITRLLDQHGHEGRFAYARGGVSSDISSYHIGNKMDLYMHGAMSRITDRSGFFSKAVTKKLLIDISEYNPDLIQLHNLHGYYLNVYELIKFIRTRRIPIVWTLHDCWTFTGHCCYFSAVECDRWKTECFDCPNRTSYPASYYDNSKNNYKLKKTLFADADFSFVTVSKWLEKTFKQSYLKDSEVCTIYNGLDTSVFKPVYGDLRKEYNLEKYKIVLGVASTWSQNKGLNDFVELGYVLPKDYKIVLIGLSRKQIKSIPPNIIGLPRTNSIQELVEWYTVADIFVNASTEETFGMTTLEAMACGTPVVVYNATALPEICEKGCGLVVPPHDIRGVMGGIESMVSSGKPTEHLLNVTSKYEKNNQYVQYIELYNKILDRIR